MEEGRPPNYRRWKTEWNCPQNAPSSGERRSEAQGPQARRAAAHGDPRPRRFFAFALIAGGANVKQVRLVLGHASAVITLTIYAHLWPGKKDRTRSLRDAVLGGLWTGCGQKDTANQRNCRSEGMWLRPSWSPRRCGRSRR